jgi:HK97 family phage major capsid protein/HK97 family phage prohead protease
MKTNPNPPLGGFFLSRGNEMPELKLPSLARDLDCEIKVRKEDTTTGISFAASSETPVERWFGEEVLSHDKGSVRLDRAKRGAMPLLFNHNFDDPIGIIDAARVEDGRLVVDAHLFNTARGAEVATMLEGGLRNVSIGYRIHVVEEDVKANRYTATDWEPHEVSIVTVPADPTVGLGRASEKANEFEVRVIRAASPDVSTQPAPVARSVVMTEQVTAPAGDNAVTAVQAEKERREAIIALCKSNNIDSRVEARWISDGIPLTKVAGEILQVMEERTKAKPTGAAELGLSRSETQRYSILRAMRVLRWGHLDMKYREQAGFELECSRAVAQKLGREDGATSVLIPTDVLHRPMDAAVLGRAMSTTPGAKGGYMVNVENMGFVDILRNRSVATRMGARTLSGLTGNVIFPRQTGKASVTWQGGEGTSVTASDQTLGQLSMTPKTAIAITDVSEQLMRQASPSAEQFVMADLAATIAIDGVDNAVINGTGGSQPLGIKNTTGITSGQDAATATYAKILAFIAAAGAVNAIRGNPGFVTNITGATTLMQRQRFTSTDTPLWDGNALDGQLVKFNAMSSEQLQAGNLIFGSWDELVIGDWGVLELATDTGGTRFNQAQVGIRALWMVDVMLRYPQAFVASVNLS